MTPRPYRNNKTIQYRRGNGRFRRASLEDFGQAADRCPACGGLAVRPPMPDFGPGFIDPCAMAAWKRSRVCGCGWKSE